MRLFSIDSIRNIVGNNKKNKQILCNWCGKNSADEWDLLQNFHVFHECIVITPQDYSKNDGKKLQLSLCNNCMDELFEMLTNRCAINPITDNEKW